MPEGHSIHRLARRHRRLFAGREVSASSPQGRFVGGAARIDGRVLDDTDAWGKHLFHRYDDDWVHVHLGLFGRFRDGRVPAPDPRGALRLLMTTDTHWAELRGPTACEVLTDPERDVLLSRLGPDPLRPDADPDAFVVRVARSRAAIGTLLMDQSVIAGVGNVYRAEILLRHQVSPFAPGREVDAWTVRAMWDDLVILMEDGVRAGRIVTTDSDDRGRPHGRPRRVDSYYAYGRAGLPCRRCGTAVESAEMAARTLFWCPACQQ